MSTCATTNYSCCRLLFSKLSIANSKYQLIKLRVSPLAHCVLSRALYIDDRIPVPYLSRHLLLLLSPLVLYRSKSRHPNIAVAGVNQAIGTTQVPCHVISSSDQPTPLQYLCGIIVNLELSTTHTKVVISTRSTAANSNLDEGLDFFTSFP